FEAADFIDETAVLGPGESLVLFTDGVTDARVGREVFGEQGLGTVLTSSAGLSAADTIGRIAATLDQAEGGLRDDIAVLVLRAPGDLPQRRR
ncbi:MAG TPA: SpoIIE family protein phosphatase, partial [Egibacteraceae bacterium]|nr:SpoIIE family protein phosphatase [Egibacteraceae bacterium]